MYPNLMVLPNKGLDLGKHVINCIYHLGTISSVSIMIFQHRAIGLFVCVFLII